MTASHDPVVSLLIERVLGEYREMPGLALTLVQAQRLWGMEAAMARQVIEALVSSGALQWSRDGRLIVR